MFKTGHKTTKECASKPTVKAEWQEQTSGRRWREVECKGCGLRTREVRTSMPIALGTPVGNANAISWRPWYKS